MIERLTVPLVNVVTLCVCQNAYVSLVEAVGPLQSSVGYMLSSRCRQAWGQRWTPCCDRWS
jgi:hypothetical protein